MHGRKNSGTGLNSSAERIWNSEKNEGNVFDYCEGLGPSAQGSNNTPLQNSRKSKRLAMEGNNQVEATISKLDALINKPGTEKELRLAMRQLDKWFSFNDYTQDLELRAEDIMTQAIELVQEMNPNVKTFDDALGTAIPYRSSFQSQQNLLDQVGSDITELEANQRRILELEQDLLALEGQLTSINSEDGSKTPPRTDFGKGSERSQARAQVGPREKGTPSRLAEAVDITPLSPDSRKKVLATGMAVIVDGSLLQRKESFAIIKRKEESPIRTKRQGTIEHRRYPPLYGHDFIKQPFGAQWKVPTKAHCESNYPPFDFINQQKGDLLPVFQGNILDYPSWQATFYCNVHVQNQVVMYKCLALDQAVSLEIKKNLFSGLGTSAYEYWLRTQRLDDTYGGQQRQTMALVNQLDCLGDVSKSMEMLQKSVFVLQQIIHTPFWKAKGPEMVGQLMHRLSPGVRRGYANYCVTQRPPVDQNLETLYQFLQERLRVKQISSMAEVGRPPETPVRKKTSKIGTPRCKKGRKTGLSQKVKRAFSGPSHTHYLEYEDENTQAGDWQDEEDETSDLEEKQGTILLKQKRSLKCYFCGGRHGIFRCLDFNNQITSSQRLQWIQDNKYCRVCLNSEHEGECSKVIKRPCKYCTGTDHHSLLHIKGMAIIRKAPAKPKAPRGPQGKPEETSKTEKTSSKQDKGMHPSAPGENKLPSLNGDPLAKELHKATSRARDSVSLSTGVIRVVHATTGEIITLNALDDSCATDVAMSLEMANRLGLQGKMEKYTALGHGGKTVTWDAMKTTLTLLDKDGKRIVDVPVYCYNNPIPGMKVEDWNSLKKNWDHLKGLNIPDTPDQGLAHIIIGANLAGLTASLQPDITGRNIGDPVARLTRLGYFIRGQTETSDKNPEDCPLTQLHTFYMIKHQSQQLDIPAERLEFKGTLEEGGLDNQASTDSGIVMEKGKHIDTDERQTYPKSEETLVLEDEGRVIPVQYTSQHSVASDRKRAQLYTLQPKAGINGLIYRDDLADPIQTLLTSRHCSGWHRGDTVQSGQPLEYCDGGTKLRQIVKHSNKPERPKAPDKKKPGKGVRRKERESVCQAAGRKDLFSSWLLQRPF